MLWKDIAERVAATFVEAFTGGLVIAYAQGQDVTRKEVIATTALAAVVACLAVIKGIAASFLGDPESASLVE